MICEPQAAALTRQHNDANVVCLSGKFTPLDEAKKELALRFGHIRQADTGILDYFFERYLAEGAPKGLSLIDWTEQHYDRKELKQAFQSRSRWWANILVDNILRRE